MILVLDHKNERIGFDKIDNKINMSASKLSALLTECVNKNNTEYISFNMYSDNTIFIRGRLHYHGDINASVNELIGDILYKFLYVDFNDYKSNGKGIEKKYYSENGINICYADFVFELSKKKSLEKLNERINKLEKELRLLKEQVKGE